MSDTPITDKFSDRNDNARDQSEANRILSEILISHEMLEHAFNKLQKSMLDLSHPNIRMILKERDELKAELQIQDDANTILTRQLDELRAKLAQAEKDAER